jgi:hypothetical protein
MRQGRLAIGFALASAIAIIAIGCGSGDDTSSSTTSTGVSGVAGATGEGGPVGAGEVDVSFAQPKGGPNSLGAKLLAAGSLKNLANVLSDTFELPDDLTVRGVNGFGPGPFFNPKDDSITYPYLFSTLVFNTLNQLHPEWSQYRLGQGVGAVNSMIFEHEFGHALINAYDLPVLGREEDAADDLAVLLLIPAKGGDQFITDAASFWAALSERQRVPQLSDYADVHSFDLQRAFSMLCLLAGSSPENFQKVAAMNVLPDSRLASCRAEFKQKADSYEDVLEPHVQGDLDFGG